MIQRENTLHFFSENQASELSGHLQLRSNIKGPKVIVVGGTHGNEPAGVEAIADFFKKAGEHGFLKCGQVDFLLGNPEAYLKDVRYIDYDLNRAFEVAINEGSELGYEIDRAQEIINFLETRDHIDLLIDLHSVSRGNEKILIYRKFSEKSQAFVQGLKLPYPHLVYGQEFLSGLLIDQAYKLGALSFAVECGNHNDKEAHFVAEQIIFTSLHKLGLIDERRESPREQSGYEGLQVDDYRYVIIDKIVPKDLGFRFLIDQEETVIPLEKDQVYAQDQFNIYKAKEDCFLLMAAKNIKESDLDVGFLCHRYNI